MWANTMEQPPPWSTTIAIPAGGDFDRDEYKQKMAEATGRPVSDIELKIDTIGGQNLLVTTISNLNANEYAAVTSTFEQVGKTPETASAFLGVDVQYMERSTDSNKYAANRQIVAVALMLADAKKLLTGNEATQVCCRERMSRAAPLPIPVGRSWRLMPS